MQIGISDLVLCILLVGFTAGSLGYAVGGIVIKDEIGAYGQMRAGGKIYRCELK